MATSFLDQVSNMSKAFMSKAFVCEAVSNEEEKIWRSTDAPEPVA